MSLADDPTAKFEASLRALSDQQLRDYLAKSPDWAKPLVQAEINRRQGVVSLPTATPFSTPLPALTLSDPATMDITAYRGDSGTFRVTVTQDGSPVDVSTATWDCDIRAQEDATTTLATMTVTPVSGQTNAVDVHLSADESAKVSVAAVWDLEMTLGGEVTTLLRGKFTATKDVSRLLS